MKKGDQVMRMLAGTVPMKMIITGVDDVFIYCKPADEPDFPDQWKFRLDTLAEVDEELGFDGINFTGSFLLPPEAE